jgi:hypothetical protein
MLEDEKIDFEFYGLTHNLPINLEYGNKYSRGGWHSKLELGFNKNNEFTFFLEQLYSGKSGAYANGVIKEGEICKIYFMGYSADEHNKESCLYRLLKFFIPYFSKELLIEMNNDVKFSGSLLLIEHSYFIEWFKNNSFDIKFMLEFLNMKNSLTLRDKTIFEYFDLLFDKFDICAISNIVKNKHIKNKLLLYFEIKSDIKIKLNSNTQYLKDFLIQIIPNNMKYNINISNLLSEYNINYNDIFYDNLEYYIKNNSNDISYNQVLLLKSQIKDLSYESTIKLIENLDITDIIVEDINIYKSIKKKLKYEPFNTKLNPLKITQYCLSLGDFSLLRTVILEFDILSLEEIKNNITSNTKDLTTLIENLSEIDNNLKNISKFIYTVKSEIASYDIKDIFNLKEIQCNLLKQCDTDIVDYVKHKTKEVYDKYEKEYFKLKNNSYFKIEVEIHYGRGCYELSAETYNEVFYSIEDFIKEYFDIEISGKGSIPISQVDWIESLLNSYIDGKSGKSYTFTTNISSEILNDKLNEVFITKKDLKHLESVDLKKVFNTSF